MQTPRKGFTAGYIRIIFFFPELCCSMPFKPNCYCEKSPLLLICAEKQQNHLPLCHHMRLYTGQLFYKWEFCRKAEYFLPADPTLTRLSASQTSELSGCLWGNRNLLSHGEGKPTEWELKNNCPASRKDQMGVSRPKRQEKIGCVLTKQAKMDMYVLDFAARGSWCFDSANNFFFSLSFRCTHYH